VIDRKIPFGREEEWEEGEESYVFLPEEAI
jgi:hypothetical protein